MKKIIIISLSFVLAFAGCSLEEHPQTILTPGGFYGTSKGIETLVNSIYAKMRFIGGGNNFHRLQMMGTDICQAGTSSNPNNLDGYTKLSSSDGSCNDFWNNSYTIINACNYVTKYLPEIEDMENALKAKREGEARFIRAFLYFHLVMQFGDVHYTLQATEDVETEANRTDMNKILDEIVYPDLDFAIDNLPDKPDNIGRVDQWSAKLLKAYVLLSDSRKAAADYLAAAALCEDVYTNSPYHLQATCYDVSDEENQHNDEVMWAIQFPTDPMYNGSGNYSHLLYVTSYQDCPGMVRVVEYGRSFIQFKPTPAYFDLIDETIDSRYDAFWLDTWKCVVPGSYKQPSDDAASATKSVTYVLGDTTIVMPKRAWSKEKIDSKTYRVFNPETATPITPANKGTYYNQSLRYYPTLKKFMDSHRLGPNDAVGVREYTVFRLADAYLLAGEAYFRAGKPAEAVTNFNVIRKRSALPGKENEMLISESDLSIDWILDERAREMFAEDNRWTDLKRLGKLAERAKMNPNCKDLVWKDQWLVRPIPQSQIDRCSNEYPQNPGY